MVYRRRRAKTEGETPFGKHLLSEGLSPGSCSEEPPLRPASTQQSFLLEAGPAGQKAGKQPRRRLDHAAAGKKCVLQRFITGGYQGD